MFKLKTFAIGFLAVISSISAVKAGIFKLTMSYNHQKYTAHDSTYTSKEACAASSKAINIPAFGKIDLNVYKGYKQVPMTGFYIWKYENGSFKSASRWLVKTVAKGTENFSLKEAGTYIFTCKSSETDNYGNPTAPLFGKVIVSNQFANGPIYITMGKRPKVTSFMPSIKAANAYTCFYGSRGGSYQVSTSGSRLEDFSFEVRSSKNGWVNPNDVTVTYDYPYTTQYRKARITFRKAGTYYIKSKAVGPWFEYMFNLPAYIKVIIR